MIKYVTYRRVSTKDQGRSGLGLDAQTRDIQTYLDQTSNKPSVVVGEFMDIMSGTEDQRPELNRALAMAKNVGAILLVAKLDRLSRKVSFIASLMEDKSIKFRVANLPEADNFQLHLYAALAEQERSFISLRTKAALAEAKARGVCLGGLRDTTNQRNRLRTSNALASAKTLEKIIVPMRDRGDTLQKIAHSLNEAKIQTPRGGNWSAMQASRVLKRLTNQEPLKAAF